MSRKRSEQGSAGDNQVETSGVLFELEDSRDKEKWSVRQRQRQRQSQRKFLTEREKQKFDEITEGFTTVSYNKLYFNKLKIDDQTDCFI